MPGPTADFDTITLVWAGVTFEGDPVTGELEVVMATAGALLDEDPVNPVSIYSDPIVVPLTTTVVGGKTVGYASFDVPVTDDPDIAGAAGPYTLTERLDNAVGVRRVFSAPRDTPGGKIYLNRLPSS